MRLLPSTDQWHAYVVHGRSSNSRTCAYVTVIECNARVPFCIASTFAPAPLKLDMPDTLCRGITIWEDQHASSL